MDFIQIIVWEQMKKKQFKFQRIKIKIKMEAETMSDGYYDIPNIEEGELDRPTPTYNK